LVKLLLAALPAVAYFLQFLPSWQWPLLKAYHCSGNLIRGMDDKQRTKILTCRRLQIREIQRMRTVQRRQMTPGHPFGLVRQCICGSE
jgi:hypothetical protein